MNVYCFGLAPMSAPRARPHPSPHHNNSKLVTVPGLPPTPRHSHPPPSFCLFSHCYFPVLKNWQSLSKFLFEHNDVFQIGKPRKDPQDPNISQFSISKVDSQVRFALYSIDDR